MDISTGPQGQGVTTSLINWMKDIFGKSFSLSRGFSSSHDGVDLPAPIGTPVYALKAGVISYARNASNDPNAGSAWAIGGGNVVNIDIGGGFTTQYAHLNTINVKEGTLVKAGDKIGTVGKTGFDIGGSHLHFGLWDRNINKMINPSAFFTAIGNTASNNLADILKLIGQTDPNHRFTEAEAQKVADVHFGGASIVTQQLTGKTVQEFVDGRIGSISLDNIGSATGIDIDVGAAIGQFGEQLNDTVTWIGFIFVGIAILLVGALLVSGFGGSGGSKPSA